MKFEKIENSHVKVTCQVEPARFETALTKAFDKVKQDVEVKGFRKGHCPREIFEKKYGVEALYEEAVNFILDEDFREILTNNEYYIVAQPKVNLQFENIKRNENFEYEFILAVKPEVTLGEYKGVKVLKKNLTVTDEEIENELKNMAAKDMTLVEKEENELALGDTAIFDFTGLLDGVPFEGGTANNYELEIGSHQFIPGFEEQMVGMKKDEERDLNVTFPENYSAENLKGKAVVFKVKLHEIKVKNYPTIDDEYVKQLGKENIDTVIKLKEDIKNNLTKNKTTQEENRILDDAMNKISANAKIDIPSEMIDFERDNMRKNVERQAKQYNLDLDTFLQLTGTKKEEFEMNLMKEATKKVRYGLVIEEISKTENIIATTEEIDAKLNEIASMYKMDLEEIKKHVSTDDAKEEVIYHKTLKFITENVIEE